MEFSKNFHQYPSAQRLFVSEPEADLADDDPNVACFTHPNAQKRKTRKQLAEQRRRQERHGDEYDKFLQRTFQSRQELDNYKMRQRLWETSIAKDEAKIREMDEEKLMLLRRLQNMKKAREILKAKVGSKKLKEWAQVEDKKTRYEEYFDLIRQDLFAQERY